VSAGRKRPYWTGGIVIKPETMITRDFAYVVTITQIKMGIFVWKLLNPGFILVVPAIFM
jgi:hypothetical protein